MWPADRLGLDAARAGVGAGAGRGRGRRRGVEAGLEDAGVHAALAAATT